MLKDAAAASVWCSPLRLRRFSLPPLRTSRATGLPVGVRGAAACEDATSLMRACTSPVGLEDLLVDFPSEALALCCLLLRVRAVLCAVESLFMSASPSEPVATLGADPAPDGVEFTCAGAGFVLGAGERSVLVDAAGSARDSALPARCSSLGDAAAAATGAAEGLVCSIPCGGSVFGNRVDGRDRDWCVTEGGAGVDVRKG